MKKRSVNLDKKENKRNKKEKLNGKVNEIKEEIKEEFFFNVPNSLTMLRLFIGGFVIYMLFSGFSRVVTALVFVVAALTDMLDGYFARKLKQTTRVGARLDQVVDRIFTVTIVVALLLWFFYTDITEKNFIFMLFLILSREIIALPGVLVRIVRGKDLYDVRYIGKLACWPQGFALTFLIAGFSFTIYFAVLTGIIGLIAGFDYLKRSFL